jgi:hypothetical protein
MENTTAESICPDCNISLESDNTTHCQHCKNRLTDSNFFCTSCGRFPSEARKKQFIAQTKNNETTGACVICGVWVSDTTVLSDSNPILCSNPNHTESFEKWETLLKVNTMIDAGYYQSLLEFQNIPVRIINQQDRSYVTTQGGLSVVRLMVPAEYTEQAKSVIQSNEQQ